MRTCYEHWRSAAACVPSASGDEQVALETQAHALRVAVHELRDPALLQLRHRLRVDLAHTHVSRVQYSRALIRVQMASC